MTTLSDSRPALSAEQLRANLTDQLCAENVVSTPSIEAALRRVPRHHFVPEISLERAYSDEVSYTKSDADGIPISAASQPRIVAMMLEQLQIQPGQRILEIRAGAGYNAALLTRLVGDDGHITTIDVDADLVDGAREHLAAAGVQNVEVVLGDGATGHRDGAPYDRIIATVGAWQIPDTWLEQLARSGRPPRAAAPAAVSAASGSTPHRAGHATHLVVGGQPARHRIRCHTSITAGDQVPEQTRRTRQSALDGARR